MACDDIRTASEDITSISGFFGHGATQHHEHQLGSGAGCSDDIRTARKRSFFWKKERRVLNVLCLGNTHSSTEHAPFFCSCGTDHTFENLQGQHNRSLWWKSS